MSCFEKQSPCQSVKIWSRQSVDENMMLFGWTIFNRFNKDIQNSKVSGEVGCIYSNNLYAAYAKKTKGGCGSVCVMRNE